MSGAYDSGYDLGFDIATSEARLAREAAMAAEQGDPNLRLARQVAMAAEQGDPTLRLARAAVMVMTVLPTRVNIHHGQRVGLSFGRARSN